MQMVNYFGQCESLSDWVRRPLCLLSGGSGPAASATTGLPFINHEWSVKPAGGFIQRKCPLNSNGPICCHSYESYSYLWPQKEHKAFGGAADECLVHWKVGSRTPPSSLYWRD